jgi:hypothetical protein
MRTVPAAPWPSRTLRAASRCRPLAGILDRRVALGIGLIWPNGFICLPIARVQAEYSPIVRPHETGIQPSAELGRGLHARHAFVVDRGQHRAANQNLATGIAFAFGMAGARKQPLAPGAQACEAFIERVNAD